MKHKIFSSFVQFLFCKTSFFRELSIISILFLPNDKFFQTLWTSFLSNNICDAKVYVYAIFKEREKGFKKKNTEVTCKHEIFMMQNAYNKNFYHVVNQSDTLVISFCVIYNELSWKKYEIILTLHVCRGEIVIYAKQFYC